MKKDYTIKELIEGGEKGDKVSFKGTIDKVWPMIGKESKEYIGYQNIIVKDSTGKIQTINNYKSKEEERLPGIEGKRVKVTGTCSPYDGKVNIFTKALEIEGEEKDKANSAPQAMTELTSMGLTREEIRVKLLGLATKLTGEGSSLVDDVIKIATKYEKYVYQDNTIVIIKKTEKVTEDKPKGYKPITGKEVRKITRKAEESGPVNKIQLLNTLLATVDNRGDPGKDILTGYLVSNNYQSAKDLTIEDIGILTKKLEKMGSDEIPF